MKSLVKKVEDSGNKQIMLTVGKEIVIRKTKKGRRYYGCEAAPECDFMSWQKPSREKCPQCGSILLEKGNKLVCSKEDCGYVRPAKEEEKEA